MSSIQLFKEIIAQWRWIVLTSLVAAICCLIYFSVTASNYVSSVSFYIENVSQQPNQEIKLSDNDIVFIKSIDAERVFNMVKSSQMIKHLIVKFDLYSHFGINPSKDFYFEKASAQLMDNIEVSQSLHNSMIVTVHDKDKLMAANLANEIFTHLDVMNKEIIVANIERKIKIYENVLKNIKSQSDSQVKELMMILEKCKSITENGTHLNSNKEPIFELRLNLSQLTTQLNIANNGMLKAVQVYGISVESIQKDNLPSLAIINNAMPEFKSNKRQFVTYTFAISVFAAWLAAAAIGVMLRYKTELKTLWG